MSALGFALLLFGCSDDGTACQQLATSDHAYVSRASCEIDQERLLNGEIARKADYPEVMVQCVSSRVANAIGGETIDPARLERETLALNR